MDQLTLMRRIEFIRCGGLTKRYHTKSTIRENTVAHHSFGVAWMVYLLHDGMPRPEVLLAALSHDLAEQVTGDISSPTKRKFPVLAEMVQTMESELLEEHSLNFEHGLAPWETRLLKMADCMDGMLFCVNEAELGNFSIMPVYKRYCQYVMSMTPQDREAEVYQAIYELMEDITDEC